MFIRIIISLLLYFFSKRKYMVNHRIISIEGDGHCLFRSIYFGLKEEKASIENVYKMRRAVCNHIGKKWQTYQPFLVEFENFQEYEKKMMRNMWGGEPEIHALVQLLKCTIKVYDVRFKKWIKYKHRNSLKTIYLRYSGGNHYDCILKK